MESCDALKYDNNIDVYMKKLGTIEHKDKIFQSLANKYKQKKKKYIVDEKVIDNYQDKLKENKELKNKLNIVSKHLETILTDSILSDEELYNNKKDKDNILSQIKSIEKIN